MPNKPPPGIYEDENPVAHILCKDAFEQMKVLKAAEKAGYVWAGVGLRPPTSWIPIQSGSEDWDMRGLCFDTNRGITHFNECDIPKQSTAAHLCTVRLDPLDPLLEEKLVLLRI